MFINDYEKFVLQMFAKSEQFTQINEKLNQYGLTSFPIDWCKVTEKCYNATRVVTIALNSDCIDNIIVNLDIELTMDISNNICNLLSAFAKIIFNKLIKDNAHFTKIKENIYTETSADYGILTLTSGDDGDYIYLMITDF